jgi:hypothetical protein
MMNLLAAGGVSSDGMWEGLLYLLPALVLVVALLVKRYPGERLLVALAARRARPRRRARLLPAVSRIELPVPRGGRLIAVSLAGRAPPPAWAGARGR